MPVKDLDIQTQHSRWLGHLAVAATVCAIIVVAHIAFTLATLPSNHPGLLSINENWYRTIERALAEDWTRLLVPIEYDPGRIGWSPTTGFLIFTAERHLGPIGSYLLFSSTWVIIAFTLGLLVSRSLLFAATLAFMFAFGTQLNYVYTYGSVIRLYLILTYAGINFAIGFLLLDRRLSGWTWRAVFVASLTVLALSAEWWINYAVAVIVACAFGVLWASTHQRADVHAQSLFLGGATAAVLFAYLCVRLQFPGQYVKPGEEEELLINYPYLILKVEDVIINFMTFLYVTLSNYLPAFVTSSNSLTYLGPGLIVAEQRGYQPEYQHLVVMSHLFAWRYYAGITFTLFVGTLVYLAWRSWHTPSTRAALVVALLLMVMTGFSTHLLIKMRPYNSVPALPYKVFLSVGFLTVLIAYLTDITHEWIASKRWRYTIVTSVWLCVATAALTRPGMQSQLLSQVGLVGLRDPLKQILGWFGGL